MSKVFCHEHLLLFKDVGKKVIPVIGKLVGKTVSRKILVFILQITNPRTHKDDIERYANFITAMFKTREELWKELKTYGEEDDEYCILTIDQEFMGAGEIPYPYEKQIQDIVDLIKKGEKIKLFVHIDCRRPFYTNILERYKKYISGLKFYNYMGTFPYDPGYNAAYKMAEENSWPCLFHCSRQNINWYRNNDIDTRLRQSHYVLYNSDTHISNKEKSMNFSNPQGFIEIANERPNNNIWIAHMGGYEEMDKFIENNEIDILFNLKLQTKSDREYSFTFQILKAIIENKHKNIWTDTSFTFMEEKYYNILRQLMKHPILSERILFGTDFPVNKTVADMKAYINSLKKAIGIFNFDHISIRNPKKLFNNGKNNSL